MDTDIKINGQFCNGCPYHKEWYCTLYNKACMDMFGRTKGCPYMETGKK